MSDGLAGVAVVAHGVAFVGDGVDLAAHRFGVEAGDVACVPAHLDVLGCGARLPVPVGDDGDTAGEGEHIDDARLAARRAFVHVGGVGAVDRAVKNVRLEHAGDDGVDAVARRAVDLAADVDARSRLADEAELAARFQARRGGDGLASGGQGERAVADGATAGGVGDASRRRWCTRSATRATRWRRRRRAWCARPRRRCERGGTSPWCSPSRR